MKTGQYPISPAEFVKGQPIDIIKTFAIPLKEKMNTPPTQEWFNKIKPAVKILMSQSNIKSRITPNANAKIIVNMVSWSIWARLKTMFPDYPLVRNEDIITCVAAANTKNILHSQSTMNTFSGSNSSKSVASPSDDNIYAINEEKYGNIMKEKEVLEVSIANLTETCDQNIITMHKLRMQRNKFKRKFEEL